MDIDVVPLVQVFAWQAGNTGGVPYRAGADAVDRDLT
jgi:hypothetical protein